MGDSMITLRPTGYKELDRFCELDRQPHAKDFVSGGSLEVHQRDFVRDDTSYLSIVDADNGLLGYFLLIVEDDGKTINFHRIVIDQKAQGVGQLAIKQMEEFCRLDLGATNIWLDVFEDNPRGIHIYEKLGFRRFKSEPYNQRVLHFYRKTL
jgi:RimJ/RimL family protein N-acetyltransferase